MDSKQAKRLGAFLRKRREALSLSSRQLAALCGVPDSTIVRLEQGLFLMPRPEKLAQIANALGLPQDEVFRLAKYPALRALPAPRAYLRAKYNDLSEISLETIGREVEAVLRRHGIEPNDGPAPGEDERPDAGRSPHKKPATKKR